MITLIPSREPNAAQKAQIARKYGMFIHFGINTFNNTEWSDGTLPLDSYVPDAIAADSWVRHAYEAGMNYVILIAKHHDGFCLFDTDTTEYCVNNTKNPTDVVAEVAKACKKYGVKLGLYYSLWDRHESCYNDDEKYTEYMCSHLRTLYASCGSTAHGEKMAARMTGGISRRYMILCTLFSRDVSWRSMSR